MRFMELISIIKISRFNLNLFWILLNLIGLLLLAFNSAGLIKYPVTLISIILITFPIYLRLSTRNSELSNELYCMILVFLPLILYNYIFLINYKLPVGLNDTHQHIVVYYTVFDSIGKLDFSNISTLSFNFVSLYMILKFLQESTFLSTIDLALIIPPILNIIIIFMVYTIIRAIHSRSIALLAAMMFGWDSTVLIIGHDLRTQTIGTILIFAFVLLLVVIKYNNAKASFIIIEILILSGIVAASFTSFLYVLLLFFSILSVNFIFTNLRVPHDDEHIRISYRLLILFIILFFFYLLYIGVSIENIISSIKSLTYNFIYEFSSSNIANPNVGQTLFGNFVKFFTFTFWLIFLISYPFYLNDSFKKKNYIGLTIILSFSTLLLFSFIMSIAGPLNPSRIYAVAFIIMPISILYLANMILTKVTNKKLNTLIIILLFLLIVGFVSSSLAKNPSYIIGDARPIRYNATIDDVPYWDADLPQYGLNQFLENYANEQKILPYLLSKNYQFSILTNNRLYYDKANCSLILIRDKFYGRNYDGRFMLPYISSFNNFNTIYSSKDYLIFSR